MTELSIQIMYRVLELFISNYLHVAQSINRGLLAQLVRALGS